MRSRRLCELGCGAFGWLGLLVLALVPVMAQGHAALVDSDPGSNARLYAAPERVELRFNEPVEPVFIRVFDRSGEALAADAPITDGTSALLPLTDELGDGGYLVSWRVVSADSHPIGGSFRFSVGEAAVDWSELPEQAEASDDVAMMGLYSVTRALFLVALLTVSGQLLFAVWVRPSGPRAAESRLISVLTGMLWITGLLQILLQGIRMYGSDFTAWNTAQALTLGFGSSLGQNTLVALATCTLVALAVAGTTRRRLWWAAWLLSLVGLGALLMTGHVVTSPDAAIALPALATHVLVASVWLGAFPGLLHAARHESREALVSLLRRFSARAMVGVALMLVAGVTLAVLQVESLDGLMSGGYGQTLILKVALVCLVLGIALDNKMRLTRRLARSVGGTRRLLQRNLRVEWALLTAVLLVTAAVSIQVPPRADVHDHDDHYIPYQEMGEVIQMMVPGDPWIMDFQMAHDSLGENQIILAFYDDEGRVQRPEDVNVRFSMPEMEVEGARQTLEQVGPIYLLTVDDVVFPGIWVADIEVLIDDFTQTNYRVEASFR